MPQETLRRHVDLGDAFQWAAGENAEGIMLSELRRAYGQSLVEQVEAMASFSHLLHRAREEVMSSRCQAA